MGFGRTVPAETGRPSYDPAAMTKLYLYGYENGIRSSRKLERETHRNVEMMWLMNGLRPDPKDQPVRYHSDKFIYDTETDTYTCPMGKILYPHNKKTAKRRNCFNKTACANGERPYHIVTRRQYSNIYKETDRRTKYKRKSFGDCFFAVFTAAVPRLFLYLELYFAAAPCFICQCNL